MDITNIIEVQEIRKLLIHHPDLLSMFELLIVMCNNRIKEEENTLSNSDDTDDDN